LLSKNRYSLVKKYMNATAIAIKRGHTTKAADTGSIKIGDESVRRRIGSWKIASEMPVMSDIQSKP
jgi:hypothetical protein